MKNKELPNVQPVKLKPFLGMKPGLWLTILYSLVLILFLVLVGIVPDLVHPSKRVSFSSEVYNAAVYVDGNYAGGTPFTKKISSGKHEVTFRVNEVELDSMEIKVSKPVFFAWLFPRKMNVNSTKLLSKPAYEALVAEFLEDLCSYSQIKEYDSVHVYPQLFTTFAKTIEKSDVSREILNDALCFVSSKEMLEDAENAFSLLNIKYDFSSIENFVNNPNLNTEFISSNPTFVNSSLDGIQGYKLNNFNVSKNCISEAGFQLFIKDNPFWSKENRDNLISQNLVDSYYLEGIGNSENKPVRNISFYAAQAYCQWLSAKTGKTVFLPTENQWMEASKIADKNYQKTLVSISKEDRPIGMFGGLWEMTDSYFIPNPSASKNDVQAILIAYSITGEMVVKGGSYLNTNIDASVKGSLPKTTCSDFLGFRIFWY